jgi:hypothetical protein
MNEMYSKQVWKMHPNLGLAEKFIKVDGRTKHARPCFNLRLAGQDLPSDIGDFFNQVSAPSI